VADKSLPYTILLDADGAIGHAYGAKTTPHMFVINKGVLIYAGALDNDAAGNKPTSEVRNYVAEALDAALAGKPVAVAQTQSYGCNVKYGKN
jgi:hypothetical protein